MTDGQYQNIEHIYQYHLFITFVQNTIGNKRIVTESFVGL